MKSLNNTQKKILAILADGKAYSGTLLGQKLGISRTAIWKQVNQLIESHIPISSSHTKGYQLDQPITMISEACIKANLNNPDFWKHIDFHPVTQVDSTSRFLKNLKPSKKISVCVADMQTEGRGRFNRRWYSPFAKNIYISLRWPFDFDLSSLAGLSLVVSLATRAALKQYLPDKRILVKWPNDLLVNDKKLCGTLIELQGESHHTCEAILGIGINVNSLHSETPDFERGWTSLLQEKNTHFDRNQIIATLLETLHSYLATFTTKGLTHFMAEWQEGDYLLGQSITVTRFSEKLFGKANGINEKGQLRLIDNEGTQLLLSSGETTIGHKK